MKILINEPLALWALLLLPIIFIISNLLPPVPKTQILPSKKFLIGVDIGKPNIKNAPLWLKILRIFGICLLILGIANPIISNKINIDKGANPPILLIFDDGWGNANNIESAKQTAIKYIKNQDTNRNMQYYLFLPSLKQNQDLSSLSQNQIIDKINQIAPQSEWINYNNLNLETKSLPNNMKVLVFCDGFMHEGFNIFIENINKIAISPIYLWRPNSKIAAIKNVKIDENGIAVDFVSNLDKTININAFSNENKIIATFNANSNIYNKSVNPRILAKATYLKIQNQNHNASTFLLDNFNSRPLIGILKSTDIQEPLLSDNYYIETAAKQFGEITKGNINELIRAKPKAIIFGDIASFSPIEQSQLQDYALKGGLIIRYGGPQTLSKPDDIILPQYISSMEKIINGSFSAINNRIIAFDKQSPLFGLNIDNFPQINKVISFTTQEHNTKIWAQFADGTPFISAKNVGSGYIILIHTSASPQWADLSYSNLQVKILERIIKLGVNNILPTIIRPPNAPLKPIILIDGYGQIQTNFTNQKSINPQDWQSITPSREFPSGIYSSNGSQLNLRAIKDDFQFIELAKLPNGTKQLNISNNASFSLKPILLIIGIMILIIDLLITQKNNLRLIKTSKPLQFFIMTLVFALNIFSYNASMAQNNKSQDDDLKLAYITTPENKTNLDAKSGLEGLASELSNRTSIEPSGVIGINPNKDELAFYPIIYWLLPPKPTPLSLDAQYRLNQYMQNGGLLFIDTRGAAIGKKASQNITKTALNGLVIPPLTQVPQNHVLYKSFYILYGFKSNYPDVNLWVMSDNSTDFNSNDGVSPILIGDGDWASAWNLQNPQSNGHEIAIRAGINIYMYALMGQYKNDQVHIPKLLERLQSKHLRRNK